MSENQNAAQGQNTAQAQNDPMQQQAARVPESQQPQAARKTGRKKKKRFPYVRRKSQSISLK